MNKFVGMFRWVRRGIYVVTNFYAFQVFLFLSNFQFTAG